MGNSMYHYWKSQPEVLRQILEQRKSQDVYKRQYPGYDEYRYQVDEITHEPYSLISYLTAKYGDFTISDVQSELTRIFQKQFKLKVEEETEIRTRTVTKTGTREVVDEETGEVTYEEYEYEEEEDVYKRQAAGR